LVFLFMCVFDVFCPCFCSLLRLFPFWQVRSNIFFNRRTTTSLFKSVHRLKYPFKNSFFLKFGFKLIFWNSPNYHSARMIAKG
jgi:hypothetical protein